MSRVLLRWFVYALLLAGCAAVMQFEALWDSPDRFMETGFTEAVQLGLLLLIVLLMLAHAWRHRFWRPVTQ